MRTLMPVALLAVAALTLAGCAATTPPATTTQPPATATYSQPAASGSTQAPAAPTSPFPIPSKTTSLTGSGATFPAPLFQTWGLSYAKLQPKIQVSYQSVGSGQGIKDITAKSVIFGASDAPLQPSDKTNAQKNGETILQFPETMGPIAVVYNVAGLPAGLKLDGETVGRIYTGEIHKWNDAAIQALNGADTNGKLPDKDIAIVYRSDSSGTTYAFTDWLVHTSPTWVSDMQTSAPSKAPTWSKSKTTFQFSGAGNEGVSGMVKSTPYSIGYVELSFVKANNFATASLKSHDGAFLDPSTDGASKAAASLAGSLPAPDGDWSKITIVDAPGAGAYPVSTLTYTLVYNSLSAYGGKFSTDQMNAFKSWMWWCLHDGQGLSDAQGYAPLPAGIVAIGETALKSIQ